MGYLVGPRINAGGRIGDAGLGARLLTVQDEDEASTIAATLDKLNRERQGLEAAAVETAEAEALVQIGLDDAGATIVVAGQGWHPGIVGIIAGRLREKFGRPSFAIALNAGGGGTGSGRSIPGVDLGRSVRAAVESGALAKGGGHAMAAGVTLAPNGLATFRTFIEADLRATTVQARAVDAILVDATLTAAGATSAVVGAMERGGPYGAGNPEPIFALPLHRVAEVARVGRNHVRLRLQSGDGATLDGIAFRVADEPLGRALLAARGDAMHLLGAISIDRYAGRERVRLRVLDAAPGDPSLK